MGGQRRSGKDFRPWHRPAAVVSADGEVPGLVTSTEVVAAVARDVK